MNSIKTFRNNSFELTEQRTCLENTFIVMKELHAGKKDKTSYEFGKMIFIGPRSEVIREIELISLLFSHRSYPKIDDANLKVANLKNSSALWNFYSSPINVYFRHFRDV